MDLENQGNNSMQLQGNVNLQANQYPSNYGEGVAQPAKSNDFQNNLEETVGETILRDLRMIGYKLKYVLLPKMREENAKELRNWDLWGPLILCLMLALTLSVRSNQGTDIFAIIFVLIWVGAFVVTLNAQLLGGKVYGNILYYFYRSFFQSVCVLGYCVAPINIGALIVAILHNILPFIVKLVLVLACFGWSTFSSIGFMSSLVSEQKKVLAVYPVFLFYLFLAWFALVA